MRVVLFVMAAAILITSAMSFVGCSYGFEFYSEQLMTVDQLLNRADTVFIGVIQEQHFDSWPFFRIEGVSERWWFPLRRRIKVETVLRGTIPQNPVDVYEIFWTGSTTGDWNLTQPEERCLFLIRKENGRLRIVRDWWRSIFLVQSGSHLKPPLDDSHSTWERFALLQFWIAADHSLSSRMFGHHVDPNNTLTPWRMGKLLRGLTRHPDLNVRRSACWELAQLQGQLQGWSQEDCRKNFSETEWYDVLSRARSVWSSIEDLTQSNKDALLDLTLREMKSDPNGAGKEDLRVLTMTDNKRLHREFCALFTSRYPSDTDHACHANQSLPATIVTENGDVPLTGPWPQ